MSKRTFMTATALALTLGGSSPSLAPTTLSTHHSRRAANSSSGAYELVADYSGPSFFSNFVGYTGHDPSSGVANYTDLAFAAQQGYIGYVYNATSGTSSSYIGVDYTTPAPSKARNSVHLVSKQAFNVGSMAVVDINHIPVQYGLWPAIWFLGSGKDWPAAGESDILEYVHMNTDNAMTLHTLPGCSVQNSSAGFQGHMISTDCNAAGGSEGCSVRAFDGLDVGDQKFATAGAGLNRIDGGVYVHDWQEDGITMWMFPHGRLPPDLVAGRPKPASWTQHIPLAKFAGDCDFGTAFADMQLIINIEFCGSWAGQAEVWNASGAIEETGAQTCDAFVRNNGGAFNESYFDIGSIKFYSSDGQQPSEGPTTFGRRGRRRSLYDTSDDSRSPRTVPVASAASSTEVESWLFVAGVFVLVGFWA